MEGVVGGRVVGRLGGWVVNGLVVGGAVLGGWVVIVPWLHNLVGCGVAGCDGKPQVQN